MVEKETVNHPSHYNREDAIECIEEMELIFGTEAVMTFCLLNTWKYRYRAADKNGTNDLEKSDWYMNKYKELKEKGIQKLKTIIESPNYINTKYSVNPQSIYPNIISSDKTN